MWLPNEKLVIDPSKFKNNDKILFCAKDGNEYPGKVLDVKYQGLTEGYKYAIELDEPLNGVQKYLTNEKKLKLLEPAKTDKPTKKSRKK